MDPRQAEIGQKAVVVLAFLHLFAGLIGLVASALEMAIGHTKFSILLAVLGFLNLYWFGQWKEYLTLDKQEDNDSN